ncbi:MAG TPA: MauE/DoxX family redox-associated membrane protein [Gaiellales bacterium]|jgi:hypothetical protein
MGTVEAPIAPLLGGLFVIVGGAKIVRFRAFREAVGAYRLARPAAVVAVGVPGAELVAGAGLLAGMRAAGWLAAGLLAAFTAALAVELASGAAPPACGCLPGVASRPGPSALLRNAVLGAAAVAAGAGVHIRLGDGFWTATYVALWVAVAGLAALVLALYRQVGVLHLRLGPRGAFEHEGEGLPLGEPAPDGFAGRLVVFTSESCPICAQIVPGLRPLASDHALHVEHARHEDEAGRRLHEWFMVPGTPFAVYVDAEGLVRAKGTVNTLEQLEAVVLTGRARERERVGVRAA